MGFYIFPAACAAHLKESPFGALGTSTMDETSAPTTQDIYEAMSNFVDQTLTGTPEDHDWNQPAKPTDYIEARERLDATTSSQLPFCLSLPKGTRQMLGKFLVAAITFIYNMYPAEMVNKCNEYSANLPNDLFQAVADKCGWAGIGSAQASASIFKCFSSKHAHTITMPSSFVMNKDATACTFVKPPGKERIAVHTRTPTLVHHSYGREKCKLNVYAHNYMFHTIGTIRAGARFWLPAATQPHNPLDRNGSRSLSNCFGIGRPADPQLQKLSALIRCRKCGTDAWDILTLQQRNTNCHFCVIGDIPLSEDLFGFLNNPSIVRKEVLPVLRANAMIANGDVATTTRGPLPADWKVTAMPDTHFDNMLQILKLTAPNVHKSFLREKKSVRHRVKQQSWCPARSLNHIMPPEPVPDKDLGPWGIDSQYIATTRGRLSEDLIKYELICPEDCSQTQCSDWSLPGGGPFRFSMPPGQGSLRVSQQLSQSGETPSSIYDEPDSQLTYIDQA